METRTFERTSAPQWPLALWKEIDDKSLGVGFDCFAEDAVCNLGVADWHGRETIRDKLRAFIDMGFTALHPTMTHFFYMDEADPTKVKQLVRRGRSGHLRRLTMMGKRRVRPGPATLRVTVMLVVGMQGVARAWLPE